MPCDEPTFAKSQVCELRKKLKIAPGTIENLILGKIFNHP